MSSEIDRARLFAYKLMNYRPRSEAELKWRLERKGYSSEVVDTVIKHLMRLGYIDDKAFARYWIACRAGKKGSYGLRQELLNKGIDIAVINEFLAELGPEKEFNFALKLAQKKITLRGGTCPYPLLAGFLKRKGFSYSIIKSVVQTLGCSDV